MTAMRFLVLTAGLGWAAASPAGGDPAVGEKHVAEKNCAACHQRLVGGDGSQLYLRSERRVKNLAQLAAQVSYCANELKAGWFPEDEEDVVAWLNHRYYHFE